LMVVSIDYLRVRYFRRGETRGILKATETAAQM